MTDDFRDKRNSEVDELTTQDLVEASRRQVLRIAADPASRANESRAEYQSDARSPEFRDGDSRAEDFRTEEFRRGDARTGDSRTIEMGTNTMDVDRQPAVVRTGAGTAAAARTKVEEELGPLFPPDEANNLRAQWDSVQVKFVDEPRQAVEDADRLIATTMTRLAEIFAGERQKLEQEWDRGGDVSTEDLRLGLRRYRSFFSRLLKV